MNDPVAEDDDDDDHDDVFEPDPPSPSPTCGDNSTTAAKCKGFPHLPGLNVPMS